MYINKPYLALFRSLLAIVLILVSQVAIASATELSSIRLGQTPDQTRVVFEVKNNKSYEVMRLSNPDRIVVDFHHAQNAVSFRHQFFQDPRLAGIRLSTNEARTRVVLDLHDSLQFRYFTLEKTANRPERLVIDLTQVQFASAPKPAFKPVEQSNKNSLAQAQPEPTLSQAQKLESSQTNQAVQIVKAPAAQVTLPRVESNPTTQSMLDANRDFSTSKEYVIAIDPGHGGRDVGAIGPGGTYEKDVVLALSLRLKQEIDRQPGMRAVLTRDRDVFLGLSERIEIARRHKADIFISVHADAYPSGMPRGGSIYVLSNRGASSVMARKLAQQENEALGVMQLAGRDMDVATVLTDLTREANLRASRKLGSTVLAEMQQNNLTLHRDTVQSAEFAVLRSIEMPSMLIEAAFISNPDEEKRLQDPLFHQAFSRSVTQGLVRFVEQAGHAPRWGETLYVNIEVQPGDTLSVLAENYGVSTRELMRLNNLRNPNQLFVGRKLSVPVTDKMMVQYEKTYIVKRGDTLSEIALKNKVTVQELMRINNLTNANQLFVGRQIKIPVKQSLLTVAAN